jgi:hypothetical protein
MTKDDFFKALITSVLGLLPITLTVLAGWLQKRSKTAKRDAAIDFAQRRVAFLSDWMQARQLSETSDKISHIKKGVADELDGIKANVDDIMRTADEDAKKSQGTISAGPTMPLLILSRLIGLVGFALPFLVVLITGRIFSSMSAVYFTEFQPLYVGLLFAMGVCLLLFQGSTLIEKIGGYLGGISAIGMALFPTSCDVCALTRDTLLHSVFSLLFFLVMALFPLIWSARMDPQERSKPRRQRNQIYKICGSLIIFCMILAGIVSTVYPPGVFIGVFWLEFIMYLAMGISWMTRGRLIFGNEPRRKLFLSRY